MKTRVVHNSRFGGERTWKWRTYPYFFKYFGVHASSKFSKWIM